MIAEDYRRNARTFLALARQIARPEEKAAMIKMAGFWLERADEADRDERIVQQPKKEPEGEPS
jgi:hypothetical protein